MTDIEFRQIREGQTVRVHYGYDDSDTKATAEGVVARIDPAGGLLRPRRPDDLVLGVGHGRGLPRDARITRVELLSEPAPKWVVGQLADITYTAEPGGALLTTVAYWSGKGWDSIESGVGFLMSIDVLAEPRLLKAVPADAVVLQPKAGATVTNPAVIRRNAEALNRTGQHPNAVHTLLALADAIEAA